MTSTLYLIHRPVQSRSFGCARQQRQSWPEERAAASVRTDAAAASAKKRQAELEAALAATQAAERDAEERCTVLAQQLADARSALKVRPCVRHRSFRQP